MLRAIYIGDVQVEECQVFEFNSETGLFHMLNDKEISYPFTIVMNDRDWFVFAVDMENEESVFLDTPRRLSDEEISLNI